MKAGALVAVVVMGDVARSPRMVNHARELASNGFGVALIGYRGRAFEVPAGVRVVGLEGGKSAPRGASAGRFALAAGLRMVRLFFALLRALVREKPGTILVQNPPSFPTLTAATLAAKLVRAEVIVDWHNYGFSLLALRLGERHWLTRLSRWYEFAAGRAADRHLCVSRAMRDDLRRLAGIEAAVLYDRPVSVSRRGQRVTGEEPMLAVCPAGWTADEDMELLLDALERMPPCGVTVWITGDGPKRSALAGRLAELRVKGVLMDTGYLPEAAYRDLVGRADLGVSLHRSSSGLDLAMKVVDLFGAGVPVCALDYGGSLGEQVEAGVTGYLFRTATDLAELLGHLGRDVPRARAELAALGLGVEERWHTLWSAEWRRVVLEDPVSCPSDIGVK